MKPKRAILAAIMFCLSLGQLAAVQVTIGSGDETHNLPMYVNFHNSLCEIIYYSNEIGTPGTITALSFYPDFYTEVPLQWLKVWLGTTDWPNMSAGWIPSTELTLAFDGMVYYPEGENQITLGLDTPFAYPGGNLVLLIQHPWEIDAFHSNNKFRSQSGTPLRTRSVVSDSNVFDPAAPPTPYGPQLTGMFPQTTLHFAVQPPQPELFIQPASCAFGEVLVEGLDNMLVSLFNTGLSPLNLAGISISGSPYFTLLQLPDLPAILPGGGSVSFFAHYEPLQPGPHSATIDITANTDTTWHTIPLTGTGIDPTIYSLPYSQNFDACAPPDLPIDWNVYTEPAGSLPFIRTFADDAAPSQPNLVRMMNSNAPQGFLFLIAPPMDESIPVNSTQLSFSAQSFGSIMDSGIAVGVLSDPQDPLSFSEVQFIDIETSTWMPYTVPLFSYQGNGRYIAVKHAQLSGYDSIKLDDVTISLLALDDLAAQAVTGPAFPNAGTSTLYQVTVVNHGNGAQADYQVQLLLEDGTLLASVPGLPVGHGASVAVPVPWTPAQQGVCRLRGRVVLTGDVAAGNDLSPVTLVTVLPAGASAVTLGSGDQVARIPIDLYRRNSLFETVLRQYELNLSGDLIGLQFYSDLQTAGPLSEALRIWVGECPEPDLMADWIPATQLQLVWDQTVELRPGAEVLPVMFDPVYAYTGGNLALMVNRPWSTTVFSSSDMFFCQTLGSTRSRKAYSDSEVLDPFVPPAATLAQLSGQFPKLSLFFQTGSAVETAELAEQPCLRAGPNPFRGECRVTYRLEQPQPVKLEILNLRGQLVQELDAGQKSPGDHFAIWNGRDASGRATAAGIYLCRLTLPERILTRKIIRLDGD